MSAELVFIPAYNEQDGVADVILSVKAAAPDVDILVIDDGSSDLTAARARAAGAKVASLPFNQGLGAALQTGYLEARRGGYLRCAHLDADGQHRPEDMLRLLQAVRDDECDLAVGSRYLSPSDDEESYSPSRLRSIGSRMFRRLLSWATGQVFTDTTSGLRAANQQIIEHFAGTYAPDYAELESLQRALAVGLRVKEYPVMMLPRSAGESKIGPWASLHFTFKSMLVIIIGSLRRRRDREQGKRLSMERTTLVSEQQTHDDKGQEAGS